ncbi:hypothetical protein CAI21_19395 [Alkalilimnicola ehrlichii]|uniref:PpiC domain-containing protein n=1 Tax=Alkalilimnicola ehrlichii TaxID=351052 RepID=A0A3E0WI38_9GAMM|nr:peptidylprolyl isomerase [Alkalilimnicola ehrlichii]RFA25350.1 hypothetical protein CAI21_19395 [Alkalilimnicola ehrlichii]RFA31535.1 hypothetical protein CAL65_22370 [Alkalilimnicola ehrlichii]
MKALLRASLLLTLLLVGCGERADTDAAVERKFEDRVLAEVGGEPVYQAELDAHLLTLFGDRATAGLGADVERKALESLVMARVLARRAETELPEYRLHELEVQAALHREQLLLNAYLQQRVAPAPVSSAMVRDFYERHPERFGAGVVRSFELLMAPDALANPARDELLEALAAAQDHSNWAALAQGLRAQGHELEYRRGTSEGDLLDTRLRSVVDGVEPGQSSAPGLYNQRPFVLRVVDEVEQPPRPLTEVSGQIRQALAAQQMQAAVRSVTEPLLEEVEIDYLWDNDDN